jgi:hypothetical protein
MKNLIITIGKVKFDGTIIKIWSKDNLDKNSPNPSFVDHTGNLWIAMEKAGITQDIINHGIVGRELKFKKVDDYYRIDSFVK